MVRFVIGGLWLRGSPRVKNTLREDIKVEKRTRTIM